MIETGRYIGEENQSLIDNKTNSELTKNIGYFRKNWEEEGLPNNWKDLPGTGFIVESQMDLLRQGDKNLWIKQTEEDVKGFVVEYLAQGLTFPIFYNIQKINGQERIVAPLYGNKLMVDTVSDKERGGIVKATLAEKIEPFLLNSPDGSIAVMTSPEGPSSLIGSNGKEIIYPDSQTYILQKKEDEVVGFTIRTDFSQEEHREFIKRLGGNLPEDASTENYVDEVVFLDSRNNNVDISDVVFAMQNARKDISGNVFAYKNRLWDEIYLDLLRREELWRFDNTTEGIFDQFKDHIIYQELDENAIKEALAVTILRIARSIRPGEEPIIPEQALLGYVLEEVQKLPGCAGGGGTSGDISIVGSITPRFGSEFGDKRNWKFDKEGECKLCKTESKALGPCGVCKPCNDKIDAQETFTV